MNRNIVEAVAVKPGILIDEIKDNFNQTSDVEMARCIYFKLLVETGYSERVICAIHDINLHQLRNYCERSHKFGLIKTECERWINIITQPDYAN